jgi:16S rRNA processing protein RimM
MEYFVCARVGAPFGIKGALHLYAFSGQPESLLKVSKFYRKNNNSYEPCDVLSMRTHGDHLVIFFKGLENPEDAARWTNQDIYLDPNDLPGLPKGKFYWHELVGMQVKSDDGEDYGIVEKCYSNHHDILQTTQGRHIPFIMGDTVLSVDKAANLICVDYVVDFSDDSDERDQD